MCVKHFLSWSVIALVLSISSAFGEIPLVYDVENTGADCNAPPLPDFADLPSVELLTDPFEWSDGNGRSTDFNDWCCRRNEIKAEIEHYEIGTKPDRPNDITAGYVGGTLTVDVNVDGNILTLTSPVTLPAGDGPFPAVIGMGFGAGTGSLPSDIFTSRDIATIGYVHNQVTTYSNPSLSDPYFQLYPEKNLNNTGQYSAWSWGVSRLIDGLELVQEDLPIDMNHLAVTGCSYAGKMALFAGALDERIALTIAQESGGGGVASWRVSETLGDVEKLGSTDHDWFKESMFQFAGSNVSKLPMDHHELTAMVAPRALLVLGNPPWVWLAGESGYVSSRAAHEVWIAFGVPERFGFSYVSGHTHCELATSQRTAVEAYVDAFLLGDPNVNTNITDHEYEDVTYLDWFYWWGDDEMPPAAPTGLAATAVSEMVLLDWNDNNEVDLDGYNVYRSQTSGSGYSKTNSVLVSDSNYVDDTVIADMNYYYVVTAVDKFSDESGYSNEVSVTTFDITPPAAPTGLTTSDGNDTIFLYWNDNTENDVNGYYVYRSTVSGSGYSKQNSSLVSNPEYTDNDVNNGINYYYVVTAVDNLLNESEYSEQAAGMPRLPIVYTFEGVTEPNTNYNAYACDVDVFPFYGTAGNRNTMVEATDSQYLDISADDTTRWTTADPGFNDEVFLWVEMKINEPLASVGRIELTFKGHTDDSGSTIHSIHVKKANSDWEGTNAWIQLGSEQSIPGGVDVSMTRPVTSYLDRYISGDGKVVWGVYETTSSEAMHINYLQMAVYENTIIEETPASPTGLAATAGNYIVSLDWDDNNEPDLDGYNVYRSEISGSDYDWINPSLVIDSNYLDNDVNNGTKYYYVVTAVDINDNESGYSNEASATPDYQDCNDVLSDGRGLVSDLSKNCYVDYWDLEKIAYYWLYTNCGAFDNCEGADFVTMDGDVDFEDFSNFAVDWMLCNNPGDPNCQDVLGSQ